MLDTELDTELFDLPSILRVNVLKSTSLSYVQKYDREHDFDVIIEYLVVSRGGYTASIQMMSCDKSKH